MSGSGRSMRKGRAIRRVIARARGAAPVSSSAAARASSSPIASALSGRPSGALASARRTTRSTAATQADPASAGGCSCSVAWNTSAVVRPPNAGRPVNISNRIAASANRSVRASASSPRSCSGAM